MRLDELNGERADHVEHIRAFYALPRPALYVLIPHSALSFADERA